MAIDEQGIVQLLQLALDEGSVKLVRDGLAESLEKGTNAETPKKNLTTIERAMGALKDRALQIGTAIAAAFALHKLVAFGRESIRLAAESREIQAGLELQLARVGKRYSDIVTQLDALNERTERQGADDEATSQILTRLISYSDNYAASLSNVQLVVDLAANKHLDFETAATVVGKLMTGNTALAERYFGTFEKGQDAIEFVRQKVNGTAEALSAQRGGLDQANIAWDNFKEAIGGALIDSAKGVNVFGEITKAVRAVTKAVEENPEAVQFMGKTMIFVARGAVTVLSAAFSGLAVAMAGVLEILAIIARADVRFQELIGDERAAAVSRKQAEALEAKAQAALRYADALDKVARAAAGQSDGGGAPTRTRAAAAGGGSGDIGTPEGVAAAGGKTPEQIEAERIQLLSRAAKIESTRIEAQKGLREEEAALAEQLAAGNLTLEQRVDLEEKLADVRQALADINPAQLVGQQMDEAFTQMVDGTVSVREALGKLADDANFVQNAIDAVRKGNADAVLADIKKEAKGHALKSLGHAATEGAYALADAARFNFVGAAAHGKAALGFLASAAKWGALAGAASLGGSGSAGGVSAGAAGGGADIGSSSRDNATQQGAPNIYITVDQFDPRNPAHQTLVGEAGILYGERSGANVFVNGAPLPTV